MRLIKGCYVILCLLAIVSCSDKNKGDQRSPLEESSALKWQEIKEMDDTTVYLVNVGYLKVKTEKDANERIAKFFPGIIEELKRSPGAIRFAPFRRNREFWNLTVWTDFDSMRRFVASKPHQDAIKGDGDVNAVVEAFKFTDYHLRKAEMPKDWRELIDKTR